MYTFFYTAPNHINFFYCFRHKLYILITNLAHRAIAGHQIDDGQESNTQQHILPRLLVTGNIYFGLNCQCKKLAIYTS